MGGNMAYPAEYVFPSPQIMGFYPCAQWSDHMSIRATEGVIVGDDLKPSPSTTFPRSTLWHGHPELGHVASSTRTE